MRTKPYRIAFGLPDEPMVQAATANITCDQLRPWVYLWGARDAVVLLPRRRPKQARMQAWTHAIRGPLSCHAGHGASAFGARRNVPTATAAQPFVPSPGAAVSYEACTLPIREEGMSERSAASIDRVQSTGEGADAAGSSQAAHSSGDGTPQRGLQSWYRRRRHKKHRPIPSLRLPPEGYTYHDDPKCKNNGQQGNHLLDFSFRAHEALAISGGGGKRYPWDRARPVTQTYSDFWSQQL